ncbi:MAG: hypothetical protein E2581_09335 [Pseudomonas sp.]|nr:hypothetical protein [Pseudomonas sp.]
MRLFDKAEKFTAETATAGSVLTYFHEHVHYFQTLFTGYGHIQWSSYRQASGFTLRKWKELWPIMGGPRIPLANCNTRLDVHQYAHYLYLVFAEQNKISQARFITIPGAKTMDALKLTLIKQSWRINPEIATAQGTRELCTKDILEGHAFFLERSFGNQILAIPPDVAWDRSEVPDVYTAAYDWFVERCGESARELFPILCDLSLQVSWEPLIPSTFEEWQASNPSWRFYSLTEALAAAPELIMDMEGGWQERYLAFCDQLLETCQFKGLNQVLSERLQALIDLERHPGISPVQRIMKKALELRIEQPWMSVYPARTQSELIRLFEEFRIPAVLVGGRYQAQSSLDGDMVTELIGELHYQAFNDQLLGNPSASARVTNSIECGFSKFGVHNGCPFQVSGECIGRFDPKEGLPIPMSHDDTGNIDGCTFGALFHYSETRVEDLLVDYGARFDT